MKTHFHIQVDQKTGEITHLDKHKNGREVMDPVPIAQPLRFKREKSYFEQIRDQVKFELSQAAEAQGLDSFEDANDFAIGDDFEPYSRHEETYGPDGLSDFERGPYQQPTDDDPPPGGSAAGAEGGTPPAKPPAKPDPVLD